MNTATYIYNIHSIILIFLSISINVASFGQPIPLVVSRPPTTLVNNLSNSDQTVPKRLIRKFKRDAARLALRLESQKEDLRYLNIVIPAQNVESIYNILTNIYRSNETARSIAECNVHTYPDPSIDHLVIIFNREVEWAKPLREGITETTSEVMIELMDDYDLVIEKHVRWNDSQDAITIRSAEPLNMAALANEFYNVEGVDEVDLGLPKVGGNDIKIERTEDGWIVEYVLKFGSYINGNGKTHTWKYQALDSGKIQFLSETGDEIPSWMRCEKEIDFLTVKRL